MIEIEYGDIEIVNDLIQESADTDIEIDYGDDYVMEADIINKLKDKLASTSLCDIYLKKHSYDPITKTILFENKREYIGNLSQNFKYNLDTFLKRHKYDEKTDTIRLNSKYIKGDKKRVKFIIGCKGLDDKINAYAGGRGSYKDIPLNYDTIMIGKSHFDHGDIRSIESTFGHEQGHVEINERVRAFIKDVDKTWNKLMEVHKKLESIIDAKSNNTKIKREKLREQVYSDPNNKELVDKYNKLYDKLKTELSKISELTSNQYDMKPPTMSNTDNIGLIDAVKERKEKADTNKKMTQLIGDVKKLFPEYKEAEEFIKNQSKISKWMLNDHDKNPEEFYADKRGVEEAEKYSSKYVNDSDYLCMVQYFNKLLDKTLNPTITDLKNIGMDKFLIRVANEMCTRKYKSLYKKIIAFGKKKNVKEESFWKYTFYRKILVRIDKDNIRGFEPTVELKINRDYNQMMMIIKLVERATKNNDDAIAVLKYMDTCVDEYVSFCKTEVKSELNRISKSIVYNVSGYAYSVKKAALYRITALIAMLILSKSGGEMRDKYVKEGRKEALDRSMKTAPTQDKKDGG